MLGKSLTDHSGHTVEEVGHMRVYKQVTRGGVLVGGIERIGPPFGLLAVPQPPGEVPQPLP